ncbi:hypothetical protein [Yinghuangia sp. YIM S09857]|uniref:hypothetical protein n=1 Tax=Yinghuangia sp. YIM S09857 TaxID=3436929 RepID=UPI003F5321CA
MSERPSAAEIGAFLGELRALRERDPLASEFAELMDTKADLLERIADAHPGDAEFADVAEHARRQADRVNGRIR